MIIFPIVIQSYAQEKVIYHPTIIAKPVYFDVSPPLRDLAVSANAKVDQSWKNGVVKNILHPDRPVMKTTPPAFDPIRQHYFGTTLIDTTIQNFDGISGNGSLCPPDTYGEVGSNNFFAIVNCSYAVYDKNGTKLLGPTPTSTIWAGMPGNTNDGDGTINYDEVHDRWIVSQFSSAMDGVAPFYQMIAVSQTSDPTGSWYRYQYQFSELNDYPKLAVWPDGIYMSQNRFSSGSLQYQGVGASAFDYAKMLVGDASAEMVYFTLPNTSEAYCLLPADCDGDFPPLGTPEYFMYLGDYSNRIGILEFHVDWTNTSNSTFTTSGLIPLTPFDGQIADGIPQKNTSVKLDPLSGRLMYRLPFRKFSDHWSVVCNATVNVGSNVAGIRWCELRSDGTAWSLYQEGTYSPDGNCRWMGSIAMDTYGNIALGYSISSSSMFPSIRYTGRMDGDPLGVMTLDESGIINGTGSQTNTWSGSPSRWGDYSGMSVDPSEAQKFWYTQEYYATTSQANWKTRIGSFSFANIFQVHSTATPGSICTGQTTQLDAGASGGSGTYTYNWSSIPAGFSSTAENPTDDPAVTTQYICAVNDGTETKTDTTTVTVHNEPTAFAGNDANYSFTLTMFPVAGTATEYSSLKWTTQGDGYFNFDTVTNALYYTGWQDRMAGTFTLTFTANPIPTCSTPASDDITVTFSPSVGIEDIAKAPFTITLAPNPAQENCKLTINNLKDASATITLTDMAGRQVYTDLVAGPQKSAVKNINLGNINRGVYFLKVMTDSGTRTEKLIVQ